jgi:enoyl-CoA hydratase
VLTGEPIAVLDLLQRGLVAEILPAEQVVEPAKLIASRPPVAARLDKEAVLASYETTLASGLDVERRAIRSACHTLDQKE